MEGAPRGLGPFPEDLSAKAEKLVTRLGVEVIKGVMVTNIDGQGVTFKRGDSSEKLAARTVLWAGGVMATPFGRKLAERTKSESDRSGRIKVNRDLTIPNFPDIFIIGDLAHAVDEKGAPLPGVAQDFDRAEASRLVYSVLNELSERDRTLLILFELERLCGLEIAAILGISEPNVWVGLSRARADRPSPWPRGRSKRSA